MAYQDLGFYDNQRGSVMKYDGARTYLSDGNNTTPGKIYFTSLAINDEGEVYFAFRDSKNGSKASVKKFISGPMPVSLGNFSGKTDQNTVVLSWNTFSEQNNDRFEIQHSTNGIQFTTIGDVKGNGTTQTEQHYSFTDNNAVSNAINYYRLNQIDFDGRSQISKMVALQFKNPRNKVTVYPNPASDVLQVTIPVKVSKLSMKIYDTQGRLQWSKRYNNPSKQIAVNVSNLPTGRYQLIIGGDGVKVEVLSFIKQ